MIFGRTLRRRPAPEPLLSETEMQDLYDEIFLEPISFDYLLHLLGQLPKPDRARGEWVMCQRTWDRIRRAQIKDMASSPMLLFTNIERMFRHDPEPETLYGLPVVIDETALHLHLRVPTTDNP